MINRYQDVPKPVYEKLLQLLKDKEYFIITTNVDLLYPVYREKIKLNIFTFIDKTTRNNGEFIEIFIHLKIVVLKNWFWGKNLRIKEYYYLI